MMEDLGDNHQIIDGVTPDNVSLAAKYKKSFAYHILQERLPAILTRIINSLLSEKDKIARQYDGETTKEDIKNIIENISKLKSDIQHDKGFTLLTGEEIDKQVWNDFLNGLPDDEKSYYMAKWLYSECYMYRRLKSIFEQSASLKTYDCFQLQKENALTTAYGIIALVLVHANEFYDHTNHTPEELRQFFFKLLMIDLWGNQCDLSATSGGEIKHAGDPFTALEGFERNLLVNKSTEIWNCIKAGKPASIIDFVLDNCGYECFTDLLLADFLLTQNLVGTVRFHVKAIPWCVSDIREPDFLWSLKVLGENSSPIISSFGKRLLEHLANGKIRVQPAEFFWTGPYEFQLMQTMNPQLYAELGQANLVIFKGDLNYRKFLADWNSPFNATFEKVLRNFRPTNLCAIRTIKADLICGLKDGVAEELTKLDPEWMETGKYGLIQFAPAL